jgi:hypothetical protein
VDEKEGIEEEMLCGGVCWGSKGGGLLMCVMRISGDRDKGEAIGDGKSVDEVGDGGGGGTIEFETMANETEGNV